MTFFLVIVFVLTFPAGVRKNPFGLHLWCVMTFFFVIALFLVPAGVRKSPGGLHLWCLVAFFFVISEFLLPAGVRKILRDCTSCAMLSLVRYP